VSWSIPAIGVVAVDKDIIGADVEVLDRFVCQADSCLDTIDGRKVLLKSHLQRGLKAKVLGKLPLEGSLNTATKVVGSGKNAILWLLCRESEGGE
jgi:hypothetical protein